MQGQREREKAWKKKFDKGAKNRGSLVKIYGSVRIVSVKKISDTDDKTWAWREGVVGNTCAKAVSFST